MMNQQLQRDGDDYIPSEENTLQRDVMAHTQPPISGNVPSDYKEYIHESVTRASGFEGQSLGGQYQDQILSRNVPLTGTLIQPQDLQFVHTDSAINPSTFQGIMGTSTASLSGGATQTTLQTGPTVSVEDLNPAKLLKEEAVIEKHLPGQQFTSNLGAPMMATTAATTTTTNMATPVTNVPLTQSEYPLVQPIPADMERQFAETNLSEVRPISEFGTTEEYLKNSTHINRVQEASLSHSQWEAQQMELASMRYENHNTFEAWEKNRALFVTDRLSLIDNLMAGMDRQLAWLDAGVEKTILFFKEREAQELEFSKTVKHSLPQLGDHFSSVNHPEVMSNFSQGLKVNDDFHAKNTQNAAILAAFIKKDVLDWTLLPSEKTYKASSAALKVPLHTFRKELDHLAASRHRAYNKYSKLYDQIQKNPGTTPKENGLFKRQLKYSLAAREELRILRLHNEQGLNVINEFAKLSLVRLESVQKAFTLYLHKYNELNRDSITAPAPVLELIERSNGPQAINTLFAPSSLLDAQMFAFAQQRLHTTELSYTDLNTFLVNFPESQDPARTSFILKEWDAIQQGGLLKGERAVNVIATTNNNLLIVEKKYEERETGKVKNPMQLRYTKVEDVVAGEDGTLLKVVERTRGTLFNHTHSSRLKFPNPEQAQEFLQYVNNQPSDV